MEAFSVEQHTWLSHETPSPHEQGEIIQTVDDLFAMSDREVIRILSKYLKQDTEVV